jgi:hypothetical protein
MGAIGAHDLSAALQEHLNASVPIARVLRGELAHGRQDWSIPQYQARLVSQR